MKKYKLQDLGTIITGKTPSTKQEDNFNGNIPFVTPEDITNNVYNLKKTGRYITEKGFASIKANTISGKSILVGCIGSDMGNVGFINSECATNQQINSITDIKSDFVPEYIYYNLCTKKEFFRKNAGSTTTPLLPKSVFSLLDIFCCDFENQQKISAVLSSLDDKIALNNRINAKLEQMAKRLYDYWFVQFDFPRSVSGEPCLHELSRTDDGNARSDFPNADGKPYKSTGGKMVWNEELKREIPERWEVKSIFDAADVIYGFPYVTEPFDENVEESNKPYSIIRIRDILENSISAKTTESVDDKYKTKIGDLLIGMDGYFHMNFWSRDNDYVNQRIVRIRKKDVSTLILYHQVLPFIKFKEEKAKGSTVGHLSDKDMKQIKVLIPNNKDLNVKFDTILSMMMARRQENLKLTAVRDKLLPLLMNGQVVVK